MKKGVSPVISVVLLVAVAITVGVFVSTWINQWVNTQTSDPSVTCAINTNYIIDSATFTNSTGELLIKITNRGERELYGFSISLSNSTDTEFFNTSSVEQGGINATNKLERHHSVYIEVNTTHKSTDGYNFSCELGRSLEEIVVLNNACSSISSSTTSVTQQ